jgi:uncharacterized membrane protein
MNDKMDSGSEWHKGNPAVAARMVVLVGTVLFCISIGVWWTAAWFWRTYILGHLILWTFLVLGAAALPAVILRTSRKMAAWTSTKKTVGWVFAFILLLVLGAIATILIKGFTPDIGVPKALL